MFHLKKKDTTFDNCMKQFQICFWFKENSIEWKEGGMPVSEAKNHFMDLLLFEYHHKYQFILFSILYIP
jgi:hypothetical protein